MKLFATLISAAALAFVSLSVQAQAVKPDLNKGAALYGQVCVACHAADGNNRGRQPEPGYRPNHAGDDHVQ